MLTLTVSRLAFFRLALTSSSKSKFLLLRSVLPTFSLYLLFFNDLIFCVPVILIPVVSVLHPIALRLLYSHLCHVFIFKNSSRRCYVSLLLSVQTTVYQNFFLLFH